MGRRHAMRTSITPLNGEFREKVRDILIKHPEYYDGYDDLTVLHAHFYQVLTQAGELAGFFALCTWTNEVVLACVFVIEEFRNQGIFNQMVEFAKKKTPKNSWLTINAMRTNNLANEIYTKKFDFFRYDEEDDINLYVAKQAHNARK